jgi:cytoskeletal protein CcmA (bactofilin family)
MAMWKNGEPNKEAGDSMTPGSTDDKDLIAFVGKGVTVKGVINYKGTVKIDGCFEGEVNTEGVLLVGSEAVIKAQVSTGSVVSYGKIIGDIIASEKVSLMAPAVLNGSLKTPVLAMEEGVLFTGQLEMTEKTPQAERTTSPLQPAGMPVRVTSTMKIVSGSGS